MSDLTYLRTFGCLAAGCAEYAEYGRHAPNCVQAEFDVVLDEVDRLRDGIARIHALVRWTGEEFCGTCGDDWPCATRRLIGVRWPRG